MAEVDNDGPTIKVNVDTSDAVNDIKGLDQATAEAVDGMSRKFNSFKENVQKTFSDLKNGGGLFANPTSGGTNTGSQSSENVARQRKQEQVQDRMIEFEHHAMRQRSMQIENGEKLLKASLSLPMAIAGLVGGGLGAKAMLDFAHNISQLQNFLKASNSNTTNALAYRNVFKSRSVDENNYWNVYQGVNSDLREFQAGNAASLDKQKLWAYEMLRQIDPSIQAGKKQGGARRTDEQLKLMINAYHDLVSKNPRNDSQEALIDVGRLIFGGDIAFAQAAKGGLRNISKADMAKAKGEADAMPELEKIDRAKQELDSTLEAEKAKFLANISPVAIDFMKSLNAIVSNHGQIAMATTALTGFIGSIGSLLLTLKLAKGMLLPNVAKAAPKGGLLSSAWKGGKSAAGWAGRTLWRGGEYFAEHPGTVLKTGGKIGGRVLGALPMAVYEGTIGNIVDAQSTSEWDGVAKRDKNGKWNRVGRVKEIEKAVDGRIMKSAWSGKYYVQTKDGLYVYLDSDFYEPIENIKRRLQNGQKDIPNQPSGSIGAITQAIIPSAKAGDLSPEYEARRAAQGRTSSGAVNSDRVKEAFNLLTQKDEFGSFTGEQAKGIIANLMGESGRSLNHQAVGDSGKAYGIAQWHPDRQANFKRLFGHSIQESNLQEQIKFLKWEMQNTEKAAGDKIRGARNANEATIASVKHYERPADIIGQSTARMGNIAEVNRALLQQHASRPIPSQIEAQAQRQRIHNETQNVTHNNGGNTANNTATVNIHIANGSVENVKKGVQDGLRQGYPSASNFNLINGAS